MLHIVTHMLHSLKESMEYQLIVIGSETKNPVGGTNHGILSLRSE